MLIAAGASEAELAIDSVPRVVGVEVPAPCTAKSLLQERLTEQTEIETRVR
ncbi:hypothetical protein ABH929_003404 [Curtobacterium sp. AB7]